MTGLSLNMLALKQHGYGYAAGIQGTLNDLGAFGNKHGILRLGTVEKLRLRQSGIYIQFTCLKIRDLLHLCHVFPLRFRQTLDYTAL